MLIPIATLAWLSVPVIVVSWSVDKKEIILYLISKLSCVSSAMSLLESINVINKSKNTESYIPGSGIGVTFLA